MAGNFLVTCERVRKERSSLAFDKKVSSKKVGFAVTCEVRDLAHQVTAQPTKKSIFRLRDC